MILHEINCKIQTKISIIIILPTNLIFLYKIKTRNQEFFFRSFLKCCISYLQTSEYKKLIC